MRKRKIPMRRCIGCQEQKDKKSLIRVVRTPEHDIVIDLTGKKSGRGAYVCRDISCLEKAQKSHAFNRALKVDIPEDVYRQLQLEIRQIDNR